MNIATLCVLNVLKTSTFLWPYGIAVTIPSYCWNLSTDNPQFTSLANARMVSVSMSSCFFESAVCTTVITVRNSFWSLTFISSRVYFSSLMAMSVSYGSIAEKLLFMFCFLCQLAAFVSSPRSLCSTSLTASSVGIGTISIESIMLLFPSVIVVSTLSPIYDPTSFKKSALPYLSPTLNQSDPFSKESGHT